MQSGKVELEQIKRGRVEGRPRRGAIYCHDQEKQFGHNIQDKMLIWEGLHLRSEPGRGFNDVKDTHCHLTDDLSTLGSCYNTWRLSRSKTGKDTTAYTTMSRRRRILWAAVYALQLADL